MASDPIPEEEPPPRMRFERFEKGPDPHVFRPAGPSPEPDPVAEGSDSAHGRGPDRESEASILKRFEALKQTLGQEIPPASPAPRPTEESRPPGPGRPPVEGDVGPDADGEEAGPVETRGSLDELQARIRRAKRREQETSPRPEGGSVADEGDGPGLTYDGLEDLTEAEAKGRRRQAKKEKRRQRRRSRSFWRELPILILVALVVAIIIKTFFFQAFYIPSGSMIPTLEINDRVLVNKLSYQFGAIERGDILVFDSPEAVEVDRSFPERVLRSIGEATGLTSPDTVLIKRVIGLPGETVAIRDNQVYVNGNPIAEPYLPHGTILRDFDEVIIPVDHIFMMGDNRNQSRDSRVFGPIPRQDIVGRAFVTVWPPGAWGGL